MLLKTVCFSFVFILISCEFNYANGNVRKRDVKRIVRKIKLVAPQVQKLDSTSTLESKLQYQENKDLEDLDRGSSRNISRNLGSDTTETPISSTHPNNLVFNVTSPTQNGGKIRKQRLIKVNRAKINDLDASDYKTANKLTNIKESVKLETTTNSDASYRQSVLGRSGMSNRERLIKSRYGKEKHYYVTPTPPAVKILNQDNYVFAHRGRFHNSFRSEDGTSAYQKGELKIIGNNTKSQTVEGGFSYKDEDGRNIVLKYTADENGYRPVGEHLPTSPPIPPEIARALFYLATKAPEADEEVKK